MADVIISTGDVNKDYEVLDIIFALGQGEHWDKVKQVYSAELLITHSRE